MNALYSSNPAEREAEAKKYQVFHKKVTIPNKWEKDWNELLIDKDIEEGLPWPDDLLTLMASRDWPAYTFGTANASCLVVLHRPGSPDVNRGDETFISPELPVLGGIAHAHNYRWYPHHTNSDTWASMYKYIRTAFVGLESPWSQVMTTCINPLPEITGKVDRKRNRQAFQEGELLDFLVELCQPRIILLCGSHVQNAARNWRRPKDIRIVECYHPGAYANYSWDKGEGLRVQKVIKDELFP